MITIFILFIIFAVGIAFFTYFLVKRAKFNNLLVIFEKIGHNWEATRKDRAMVVKFGHAGDSVFYTRKTKKYLPTPSIQTGRRTYWYAIREDGEWINIGIEDIDEKCKRLNVRFLDKEMRYARVALQRSLKDRYDKPSFLTKYGGVLAITALVLVTGVMIWLLFDKFIEISQALNTAIESAGDVNKETAKILSGLSNVKSGSGLYPG